MPLVVERYVYHLNEAFNCLWTQGCSASLATKVFQVADRRPSFERLKRWSSPSKESHSSSSVMIDFCREIKPGLDSLDVKPTSSEAFSRRNASFFMSPKSARWSARSTLTLRGGRKSKRKRSLSTSGILPPSIVV